MVSTTFKHESEINNWIESFEHTHIVTLLSSQTATIKGEDISRLNARRSLIIKKNIKKGTVIKNKHLTWKRPAIGISPKYLNEIIGRKINQNLKEDEILKWDFISD